jgi:class 3 adenylate cyclase
VAERGGSKGKQGPKRETRKGHGKRSSAIPAVGVPRETLQAIRAATSIPPETLKALRAATSIPPETLKALRAATSIPPETLKALREVSRIIPSSTIAQELRAAQEANRLRVWAGTAASEGLAERQLRALRNAAVHAEPKEPSSEIPSEPDRLPPPKTAREQRVRRMAPPGSWPRSREANRVRRAAMERTDTDVVVLAADIRHSTDLMNEAVDQHVFAATLEGFVSSSRECVWRNRGWYANFTGDGFLAFWPTTNGTRNASVRRALATISELFSQFERIHIPRFASNARNFREDTGLCVGLDQGAVAIVEVGEEATVVGMPVVGATRLVSAGYEWEVLANNLLGVYLTAEVAAGSLQGVDVEQVIVTTKDFDALRAYSIQYEWTQRPLRVRERT